MDNILSVKNLTVKTRAYLGQSKVLLNDISLDLQPKESLALVGNSGSGKSLTALSIPMLLPTEQLSYSSESCISLDGVDVLGAKAKTLRQIRRKIGVIFQEPMVSLSPFYTIGKQIAEVLRFSDQKLSKREIVEKALNLLERVKIDEPQRRYNSYPHELSGGQKQRVIIAMAIARNPQLLIADEPTTALDVSVQASILDLLMQLRMESNMAILFISHDLGVVRDIADRLFILRDGEIVERGETTKILNDPQHPYTKSLRVQYPTYKPDASASAEPASPILQLTDLTVSFSTPKNKFIAVDKANLTLGRSECLGIVGESGSGKTTLAKAVVGIHKSQGKILWQGQHISALAKKAKYALRQDIQMVFQDPYGSLSPRMNVQKIVGEVLKVHRPSLSRSESTDLVVAALESVGLVADDITKYPHEFSGGQRQRIALARSIILPPKLLILDEPTSALDFNIQIEIVELLISLREKFQLAYLFISHDLELVSAFCERVTIMKNGKIVETGLTEEVLLNPKAEYTKNLVQTAQRFILPAIH